MSISISASSLATLFINFDSLVCMFSCCFFQLCFLHWCSWTDSYLSTTVHGWKSFLSHFQENETFLKYQRFEHFSPPHRMNAKEIICYLNTMRKSFSEYVLHKKHLKQSDIWIFLVKSLNLLISFAGLLKNSDIIGKYGLHIRFAIFAVFEKKIRWSFQLQISVNAIRTAELWPTWRSQDLREAVKNVLAEFVR